MEFFSNNKTQKSITKKLAFVPCSYDCNGPKADVLSIFKYHGTGIKAEIFFDVLQSILHI